MDENSESTQTDPALPAEPEQVDNGRKAGAGAWLKTGAILVILIALAVAGWFGWQGWQQQQTRLASAGAQDQQQQQAVSSLQQQTQQLQSRLADDTSQVDELRQQLTQLQAQLNESAQTNKAASDRLDGLMQRTAQLESAVSGLSQKQVSGAERMRLDDVEMLLTQAGQRYSLLHDGVSALAALRMARRQLADADDPALAGVARTLDDEISALAATRPAARHAQLTQLEKLRTDWQSLPLKPTDQAVAVPVTGAWDRIWAALSTLVVVHHDSGEGSVNLADERLAQQVAKIDLARAEAALMANEPGRALSAIQRVSKTLTEQYDAGSAAVQQANQTLTQLANQLNDASTVDVQLGAALTALRNQLQVREMNTTPAAPPVDEPAHTHTATGA